MEGIFFARFDDVAGSVVECQASVRRRSQKGNEERPSNLDEELEEEEGQDKDDIGEEEEEDALDPELWDRVSDFIIVRKELCGSLLTVSSSEEFSQNGNLAQGGGKQVLACPLYLEGPRYPRNTFFFSFGFVLQEDQIDALTPRGGFGNLDNVLRKLSLAMQTLETENGFLSREGAALRLRPVLRRVLDELREFGECIVAIDEANTLALKITPRLIDPPEVLDYQVPVQTRDIAGLVSREWDLTFLEVLRFIDGNRHVKLISELSGVAVALVRRCIRQLLYFRCVRLVDIFQFSAAYVCTAKLGQLVEDENLQRICRTYVWNGFGDGPPPLARVFQLYAALQPCLELKDFCLLHDPSGSHVDVRKLIVFGVLHGLVSRVHKFPILVGAPPKDEISDAEEAGYAEYCKSVQDYFDSAMMEESQVPRFPMEHGNKQKENNSAATTVSGTSSSSSKYATSLRRTASEELVEGVAATPSSSLSSSPLISTSIPPPASLSRSHSDQFTNEHSRKAQMSPHDLGEANDFIGREEAHLEYDEMRQNLFPLLNGYNCYDAICCELWRSPEELDTVLQARGNKAVTVALVQK